MMKLSDFDFELPAERIARFPAEKRDGSKLMVVNRGTGDISHHSFTEIVSLLDKNSFLVMNNSKVIPARLFGKAGEGNVEILIVKRVDENSAEIISMPAKKLTIGKNIMFDNGIKAVVKEIRERGKRILEFNKSFEEVLKIGFAPLPPYIKRKRVEADKYRDFDLKRYQTLFSKEPGSIAAPTAGLHFSKEILKELKDRFPVLEITLDVGTATFQKIEAEDINDHKMGREIIHIDKNVSEKIKTLKKSEKKLVAVGTTSVRSLETYALLKEKRDSFESELFIFPGFEFKLVDRMITNFHLPKSSLFILVSAFAGLELMKKAYMEAIRKKYRFFSYGDAMLIL